jgi:hypothetical protein
LDVTSYLHDIYNKGFIGIGNRRRLNQGMNEAWNMAMAEPRPPRGLWVMLDLYISPTTLWKT